MASDAEIGERVLDVLVQMWAPQEERLRKLGMIAAAARQFEAWWKFEIATAWEQHHVHAPSEWEDVWCWLEYHDRADVLIARPEAGTENVNLAGVLIPLELKTTGTWWRQPTKALAGLQADLADLSSDCRASTPFAAVGMLVTHVEWDGIHSAPHMEDFESLVRMAIQLGDGLALVRNTLLHAGRVGTGGAGERAGNGAAMARQLIWTRPAVSSRIKRRSETRRA